MVTLTLDESLDKGRHIGCFRNILRQKKKKIKESSWVFLGFREVKAICG